MKKSVRTLISLVIAVVASFLVVVALPAQDKFSLKAPNGVAFAEIRVKDSRRFPKTGGWGYARFPYDAAADAFSVFGANADFGNDYFNCHAAVKDQDYVFTKYPAR